MEKEKYYQEKYQDLERNYKAMEENLQEVKFHRNWLIALFIILMFVLLISISMNGTIINNQGYTLEQVTNATIQICKALS